MVTPPQLLQFYTSRLLKRIELYLVLCGLFIFLTATRHSDTMEKGINIPLKKVSANAFMAHKIDSLVNFALTFQGVPYHYGGKKPTGFDCSGFTGYVFRHVGIRLNASSQTQFGQGRPVVKDSIRKGDLVFFRITNNKINHVGIVTERTEENVYFIHASSSQGIKIDNLENPYYTKWLVGFRRVIPASI